MDNPSKLLLQFAKKIEDISNNDELDAEEKQRYLECLTNCEVPSIPQPFLFQPEPLPVIKKLHSHIKCIRICYKNRFEQSDFSKVSLDDLLEAAFGEKITVKVKKPRQDKDVPRMIELYDISLKDTDEIEIVELVGDNISVELDFWIPSNRDKEILPDVRYIRDIIQNEVDKSPKKIINSLQAKREK